MNPTMSAHTPRIPNGVVGMGITIIVEIIYFASLVSSYLVLRAASVEWPPWGQPRLPIETTAFNTMVLLLSGFFLFRARKQFLSQPEVFPAKLVLLAILFGSFFVFFQGYEWVRLINFGLTAQASQYGSIFYLLIGSHAVHVTAGLCGLCYLYYRGINYQITTAALLVGAMFWYFIVGLWPILYVLVYLS